MVEVDVGDLPEGIHGREEDEEPIGERRGWKGCWIGGREMSVERQI